MGNVLDWNLDLDGLWCILPYRVKPEEFCCEYGASSARSLWWVVTYLHNLLPVVDHEHFNFELRFAAVNSHDGQVGLFSAHEHEQRLLIVLRVEVNDEAFSLEEFKGFLTRVSEIHVSELSIFEAKAKIFRFSKEDAAYTHALKRFGENLAVLRKDEKFVFHPYTEADDTHFNLIASITQSLDSFDIIILAQTINVGLLITEDKEILSLRQCEKFKEDPFLGKCQLSGGRSSSKVSWKTRAL